MRTNAHLASETNEKFQGFFHPLPGPFSITTPPSTVEVKAIFFETDFPTAIRGKIFPAGETVVLAFQSSAIFILRSPMLSRSQPPAGVAGALSASTRWQNEIRLIKLRIRQKYRNGIFAMTDVMVDIRKSRMYYWKKKISNMNYIHLWRIGEKFENLREI